MRKFKNAGISATPEQINKFQHKADQMGMGRSQLFQYLVERLDEILEKGVSTVGSNTLEPVSKSMGVEQ